jgi:hypothetical protein
MVKMFVFTLQMAMFALLALAYLSNAAKDPFEDVGGDIGGNDGNGGGDDGDDGITSTLQQKLFTSSLNAQMDQVLENLDAKSRASINAVRIAAKNFMQTEDQDAENALIQAVNNHLEEQNFGEDAGDTSVIAKHMVLNMKEVAATQGICWSCPLCAIFAGPLSLSWPIFAATMKVSLTCLGTCVNDVIAIVLTH